MMSFAADEVAPTLIRMEPDSRDRVRLLKWWLSDHWKMPHYLAGIIWC